MTKKVFASFLLALLLCIPSAYGYTVQDLIGTTPQTGLQVGDKIFYGFTFGYSAPSCASEQTVSCTWSTSNPAQINVVPFFWGNNPGLPGISFQGAIGLDLTNYQGNFSSDAVDIQLGYWVTTVSGLPLITDIHQHFVGSALPATSNIRIDEVAKVGGEQVGSSHLTVYPNDPNDPIAEGNDQIILQAWSGGTPPYTTIQIQKDILLSVVKGGSAQVSIIDQAISQVPEPGFYGALALGLSGLVLAFRRRSAAK